MTLIIKIKMDNAAFDGCNGWEAARILADLADDVRERELMASETTFLRDSNGNRVGEAKVTR